MESVTARSRAFSLSSAIVREFLTRKNLHHTLRELDHEMPRSSRSISNSRELAQLLNMEAIFVKNKQRATYETLLEMMVDYIIKKSDVQDKWRSMSQVCLGKDRYSHEKDTATLQLPTTLLEHGTDPISLQRLIKTQCGCIHQNRGSNLGHRDVFNRTIFPTIVGSKPSCSRGASREENEMTCEEYSVYLQEIVKNRRHGTSPVKSPSLRHKEEILLTSLRGRTLDCDNSTRLGPNKQSNMFEHLLQADSTRTEQHEAFQSVPQLAVYDKSPNSIRPLESLWRRKSDSNALPRTKEIQENNSLLYVQDDARRKSDSNTLHVQINDLQINDTEYTPNESDIEDD